MSPRQSVVITLIAAIILVLIGVYFVERQRMVSPSATGETWGSIGGHLDPEPVNAQPDAPVPLPNAITTANPDTLVIPAGTPSPTSGATKTVSADGTFDYNAMLAQMRSEGALYREAQASSTFNQLANTFSFTPTVPETQDEPPARTAKQEAIFAYGNRIGTYLQGFAAVNPNMTQALTNQINHRDNKQYGDAVRDLGDRYTALGESVLAVHDVPPGMENAHAALGQSYVNLGKALRAVPDAADDRAFLAAITAYNNKADAFTRAYIDMAQLFTTNDVSFAPTDPGSAFSFRHN